MIQNLKALHKRLRYRAPAVPMFLIALYLVIAIIADKPIIKPMQTRSSADDLNQDSLRSRIKDLSKTSDRWRQLKIALMGVAGIAGLLSIFFEMWQDSAAAELASTQDQLQLMVQNTNDKSISGANERASAADERASKNEKEAGLARKDASEANALAKRYEAEIAGANERALQSSLELARFKAPRDISTLQREKMLIALGSLAKGSVKIQSLLSAGNEAFVYANQIAEVFQDAEWKVTKPDGMGGMAAPIEGVFFVVGPGANKLADSLVPALLAGGVVKLPVGVSPTTDTGRGVEIWVAGKKTD